MRIKCDRAGLAALGLVILAVMLRLMLLEWDSHRLRPDQATVALMGKHIYEQNEFPAFFYDQNWFGSVESFMHAFFFRIFGVSTHTLGYAPIFFFALFVLILYLLARDLFSSGVGLWAAGFCILPPVYLLDFSMNPQGGYIETLTFGALILWLSVRLIKHPNLHSGWLGILGLAAGFAWWTSPLTIHFILTSALFILLVYRAKVFHWKLIFGIAGFMIGSFPFWIFHIIYSVPLTGFSTGFNALIIPKGIHSLLFHDIPSLMDLKYFRKSGFFFLILNLAFYTGAIFMILRATGKDFCHLFRIRRPQIQGKSILPLFFLVFVLIYSSSQHALEKRERYVLPLFTLIPIACGTLLDGLYRKKRILPPAVMAGMLFVQGNLLERYLKTGASNYRYHLGLKELETFLSRKNIYRCYVDYVRAPVLAFMSGEKIIASAFVYEKYPPYESAVDEAENPAMLFERKYHLEDEVQEGINYLGGSLQIDFMRGFMMLHDYIPPGGQYKQIDPAVWAAHASHNSKDASLAFDRNAGRKWNSLETKKDGMTYELDLGKEYPVGMVKVWNHFQRSDAYPNGFKLQTSLDGKSWEKAAEARQLFNFYWSGPRLYPFRKEFRLEIRFSSRTARYLRLTQFGDDVLHSWSINEIFVYEFLNESPPPKTNLLDILRYLDEKEIRFVYADSWLSSQIAAASHGSIQTLHPYQPPPYRSRKKEEYLAEFGPDRAFIVREEDGDIFRSELRASFILLDFPEMMNTLEEKTFGQDIVFHFKTWTDKHDLFLKKLRHFHWIGFTMVPVHSLLSRYLTELGDISYQKNDSQAAKNDYEKAIQIYPENLRPYQRLEKINQGKPWEPDSPQDRSTVLIPHYQPFSASFEYGIQLLGFQWSLPKSEDSSLKAEKGEQAFFNTLWREDLRKTLPNISVFMHFEKEGSRFQADHPLLPNRDDDFLIPEQGLVNFHSFKIPETIATGSYSVYMGLYQKEKRLKIKRSSPPSHHERILIGSIEIVNPSAKTGVLDANSLKRLIHFDSLNTSLKFFKPRGRMPIKRISLPAS